MPAGGNAENKPVFMAFPAGLRFAGAMQRTYFITATNTGAGKTVLTALLAQWLRERGVAVAALKPLGSGGRADAEILHAALGGTLTLEEINPWHFRSAVTPALAARQEKKPVKLATVLTHLRARQKCYEVLLVEGAGGLLSPLVEDGNSRDLISALDATPIIVAPNQLGVVNHVLLTLEALPKKARAAARVVFRSPARPDSATATNAQLLAPFFPPEKTFVLPWLGRSVSRPQALKNSQVRRMLPKLVA